MLSKIPLLVLLGCMAAVDATNYPFPGDCSLFQECDDHLGGCVIKTCGPGTEFHPEFGNCGWPLVDRSNCGNPDIDIRLLPESEQAEEAVYSDYASDCTKYQKCSSSGCYVFSCDIGLEFNPETRKCEYPFYGRQC